AALTSGEHRRGHRGRPAGGDRRRRRGRGRLAGGPGAGAGAAAGRRGGGAPRGGAAAGPGRGGPPGGRRAPPGGGQPGPPAGAAGGPRVAELSVQPAALLESDQLTVRVRVTGAADTVSVRLPGGWFRPRRGGLARSTVLRPGAPAVLEFALEPVRWGRAPVGP